MPSADAAPSLLSRLSPAPGPHSHHAPPPASSREGPPHLRNGKTDAVPSSLSQSVSPPKMSSSPRLNGSYARSPPTAHPSSFGTNAQNIPTSRNASGSRWAASPPNHAGTSPFARSPPVMRAGQGAASSVSPGRMSLGGSPSSGSALDQIESMLAQIRTQSAASPPTKPSSSPYRSPSHLSTSLPKVTLSPPAKAAGAGRQVMGGRSKWARAGDAEADDFPSVAAKEAAAQKETPSLPPPVPVVAQPAPAPAAAPPPPPSHPSPPEPPKPFTPSSHHIDWADDDDDDALPSLDDWGVDVEPTPFEPDPEPEPSPPPPAAAVSAAPAPPQPSLPHIGGRRQNAPAASGNAWRAPRLPRSPPSANPTHLHPPPHLAFPPRQPSHAAPARAPPPHLAAAAAPPPPAPAPAPAPAPTPKAAPRPIPPPTNRIFASARAAATSSAAAAALSVSPTSPSSHPPPAEPHSLADAASPPSDAPPPSATATAGELSQSPPWQQQPTRKRSTGPPEPSSALFSRLSGIGSTPARPAAQGAPPKAPTGPAAMGAGASGGAPQGPTGGAGPGAGGKKKSRGGKHRGGAVGAASAPTGGAPHGAAGGAKPSAGPAKTAPPAAASAPPPAPPSAPAKEAKKPAPPPAVSAWGRGGGGTQTSKWA
ncbi:hypothetical protein JCM10207_000718 [Rhodosporidiobolus poonsookiae]